ncbi:MAG TPA: S8 family serine peptidase [Gemmatimonadales bacterium]|nr:S8 family serine peptidase [Gemmatimonadales bacterium]
MRFGRWLALIAAITACKGGVRPAPSPAPQAVRTPVLPPPSPPGPGAEAALPPNIAFNAGFMPLASTGVDRFRRRHLSYDGRGVLIGILDSGIDPGVDGLQLTSYGAPKILDVRDFSGEGIVPLTPVTPGHDGTVRLRDRVFTGTGRIMRITTSLIWYGGEYDELRLGRLPGADLNGNGTNTDVYPVIVVKAPDGWVAFIDTNLDGSFEDETPLHDYREGRETLTMGSKPVTLAANFDEAGGAPVLDLVFDNSGHGTHVAGIAAGHELFDVRGFDGVAPGAQLIGLKIANNARGGVSVTGSMQRAMAYAARFAEARGLPLVLNLSFGVGNEFEGRSVLDSIVTAFLLAHPDVVFAISAGNDGPGLSTLGFPASADLALAAGAAFPGVYARPRTMGPPTGDVMGWWSSRGGELAKPDIITPGVAFSVVPRFDRGEEFKGGTSMAAPYAAGLAARLMSAMREEGRSVSGADVQEALRASANRLPGGATLDEGPGQPDLESAYRWLAAGHQGSAYQVRTRSGRSAAFRRNGLSGPGDTVDVFTVRHLAGLRAAEFVLRSRTPWMTVPETLSAGALETAIPVRYEPQYLREPGVYEGTVPVWNASDTLAGPAFTLVSTVVVPHDLDDHALYDERRSIGPARVQRYFLRVLRPQSSLHITVTLPDSLSQGANARLYEPSGQPFRDADELSLGHHDPGTGRFVVRGDDFVPGVYELDVFAPPLTGALVTVRAEATPLTLTPQRDGIEVANAGSATFIGRPGLFLIGAQREFNLVGRGTGSDTVTVRVPEWAATALVEVEMARAQWNEFTGFGVTEFDSSGQQVGQNPLNYAFGRQSLAIPGSVRRHPLLIELAPAFARSDGGHPWRATVRVRFLLDRPQSTSRASEISVVPGGRTLLTLPSLPLPSAAEGFAPLAELWVRATVGGGADAVRWVVTPLRR